MQKNYLDIPIYSKIDKETEKKMLKRIKDKGFSISTYLRMLVIQDLNKEEHDR